KLAAREGVQHVLHRSLRARDARLQQRPRRGGVATEGGRARAARAAGGGRRLLGRNPLSPGMPAKRTPSVGRHRGGRRECAGDLRSGGGVGARRAGGEALICATLTLTLTPASKGWEWE